MLPIDCRNQNDEYFDIISCKNSGVTKAGLENAAHASFGDREITFNLYFHHLSCQYIIIVKKILEKKCS